jgi:hypothetical protein
MTKRDYKRIESKEREWDLAIRAAKRKFIKKWENFKVKFRIELRKMLNFIMFYKSSDKRDRNWHIFEMVIIYFVLQCAWKGIWG